MASIDYCKEKPLTTASAWPSDLEVQLYTHPNFLGCSLKRLSVISDIVVRETKLNCAESKETAVLRGTAYLRYSYRLAASHFDEAHSYFMATTLRFNFQPHFLHKRVFKVSVRDGELQVRPLTSQQHEMSWYDVVMTDWYCMSFAAWQQRLLSSFADAEALAQQRHNAAETSLFPSLTSTSWSQLVKARRQRLELVNQFPPNQVPAGLAKITKAKQVIDSYRTMRKCLSQLLKGDSFAERSSETL